MTDYSPLRTNCKSKAMRILARRIRRQREEALKRLGIIQVTK